MSRFVRIDDVPADERTRYFADLVPEELMAEKGLRLIGAVNDNGIPEGAVAFEIDDNMASILHVEVYESLRRQGIGTAIVRTLLLYLALAELPFIVQAVYSTGEDGENEGVDAFFKSLPDFEVVSGGRYCTVTPDTVLNPARLKLLSGHECSVTPYTGLSNMERNLLISDLEEKNLESFLSLEGKKLVPELSLCHMEKGRCTTCVIFTETDLPDTVELSFLMSKPADRNRLAGVLFEVIRRYKESYPKHNMVFSLVSKDSELLAKNFFAEGMKEREILTAVSFGEV